MSGISSFAVGVISGSGEEQGTYTRQGSFPRTRDLGGLVVSGSLTVLGAPGGPTQTDSFAPGLTGSLTTLPDGSALVRAGANITISTGSVPCADKTGRNYAYINIEASGGSGDVSGPGSSVDNNLATFDGTGGKTIQANASTSTLSDAGLLSTVNISLAGSGATFFDGPGTACQFNASNTVAANTITLGGGSDVRMAGDLELGTNIINSSAGATNITLKVAQAKGTTGDVHIAGALAVSGSLVAVQGGEGEYARLGLAADEGDDAGDRWWLTAEAGNNLVIQNDMGGADVPTAMLQIQPAAAAIDSVVQVLGKLENRSGEVTYGDDGATSGAGVAASIADVAIGALNAGSSIKILELGTDGVASGDVTGAAGVITLHKLGATDSTAARKAFNFTCVCTSDGATNGDEGVITWIEAYSPGTQTNIQNMFAAKLTLRVEVQSNKWEVHLVNENPTGQNLASGCQATYNVQTTLVGG